MTPGHGVDLFLRVLSVGERLCVEGKGRGCILSYHRPVSDIVGKRKRAPHLPSPSLPKGFWEVPPHHL